MERFSCHLQIESQPLLRDLRFKSKPLEMDDLDPQSILEPAIAMFGHAY